MKWFSLSATVFAIASLVAAPLCLADEAEQIATINEIGRSGSISSDNAALLLESLSADSAQVRRSAALALAQHGGEIDGSTEALIAALDDKEAAVRSAAAFALGRTAQGSVAAAQAVAKKVTDPDDAVRRASVTALHAVGADRELVRPVLLKTLQSGDPATVAAALNAFASMGEEIVDDLKQALAHDEACYWACLVIQEMGPVAADTVEPLTKVLKSEEPEERLQAILALGAIGEKARPAGDALAAILKNDEFEGARFSAAYALGQIGAKGVADDQLKESVKSDIPLLRLTSAWSLAELYPDNEDYVQQAAEVILEGMKSDDPMVSRIAARLLIESDLPPETTMPVAASLLENADEAMIEHVIDALAAQGAKAVPRVVRALGNEKLRLKALAVIQRIGPEASEAVNNVVPLLKSDDSEVRREALYAIAAIGSEASSAAGPLSKAYLAEDTRENRLAAIYAAGRIGPEAKAFVPHLKKLATHPDDEQARVAALWALARIAPNDEELLAEAIPAMIKALGEAELPVFKIELAHTLGDLGPKAKAAAPTLKALLNDPSVRVRAAAATALEQIGG